MKSETETAVANYVVAFAFLIVLALLWWVYLDPPSRWHRYWTEEQIREIAREECRKP